LIDANQEQHHQIAYEKTTFSKENKQTKTRPRVLCLKEENKHQLVGFGCYTCGIASCCPRETVFEAH